MAWKPISERDFSALLREEIAQLDSEGRELNEAYSIQPVTMLIAHAPGAAPDPVFVVARSGTVVVYYDDVEEEFATGRVVTEGAIEGLSLFGALNWALRGLLSSA